MILNQLMKITFATCPIQIMITQGTHTIHRTFFDGGRDPTSSDRMELNNCNGQMSCLLFYVYGLTRNSFQQKMVLFFVANVHMQLHVIEPKIQHWNERAQTNNSSNENFAENRTNDAKIPFWFSI